MTEVFSTDTETIRLMRNLFLHITENYDALNSRYHYSFILLP